ncbi:hypothetical protein [Thiolapillus sp.]
MAIAPVLFVPGDVENGGIFHRIVTPGEEKQRFSTACQLSGAAGSVKIPFRPLGFAQSPTSRVR